MPIRVLGGLTFIVNRLLNCVWLLNASLLNWRAVELHILKHKLEGLLIDKHVDKLIRLSVEEAISHRECACVFLIQGGQLLCLSYVDAEVPCL